MALYVFTGDGYGDRVLHDYDSILATIENVIDSPNRSLNKLRTGEITEIKVPDGKITLYKERKLPWQPISTLNEGKPI